MAHQNEELARRGFDAFQKGDLATIQALFADDIVWHVPGRGPLAGDQRGKDAVMQWLAKTVELTGGTFRLELHDLLANDEHAVALTRITAEREGKKLDSRGVQVLHVKDGKVTESWLHPDDLYATDEFWS